jgi:hypothetical protein
MKLKVSLAEVAAAWPASTSVAEEEDKTLPAGLILVLG